MTGGAVLGQDPPGLLTAREVGRETILLATEASQVHDALDACVQGGRGEGPRRQAIALLEPALSLGHRVHEVVGDPDLAGRGVDRLGPEDVQPDRVDARPAGSELLGTASGRSEGHA
jgi:hypothetical protein